MEVLDQITTEAHLLYDLTLDTIPDVDAVEAKLAHISSLVAEYRN